MATKKGKARSSATSSAKAATNPGAQAFGAAAAALVQLDGVASAPAKAQPPRRPSGWRVLEEDDPVADLAELLVWVLGLAGPDGGSARPLSPVVQQRLHRAGWLMLRHGDSFEAAIGRGPGVVSLRTRVLEFARDRHLMHAGRCLRNVTPWKSLEDCMVDLLPAAADMGKPGWRKVLDGRSDPPPDLPKSMRHLWQAAKFGWECDNIKSRPRTDEEWPPLRAELVTAKSPIVTTEQGMRDTCKRMSMYSFDEHPFTLLAEFFL